MPTSAEMSVYIAQSRPVIFRGAAKGWKFRSKWSYDTFMEIYGTKYGHFSKIPYASSFNFASEEITLLDWVRNWDVQQHNRDFDSPNKMQATHNEQKKSLNDYSYISKKANTLQRDYKSPTYLFSSPFAQRNPTIKEDG